MTLATFVPKGRAAEPEDTTGLKQLVVDVVNNVQAYHPRTLQRKLGPSEIGEDCPRQLAYKISNHPEVPYRVADQLPSFLGIAAHARMAEACELWNRAHPGTWIIEKRVSVPGILDGGEGTGDAFHVPSGTVLDWKFLGDTTYRKIQTLGPGRKYRSQVHTYGLGWTFKGYRVNRVAIGVFGRSKPLSGMFVWAEEFRPDVAWHELKRVQDIRTIVEWVQQRGGHMDLIPAVPGDGCFWCPFRGEPAQGFCSGRAE
jgi:hypothetical protein